MKCSIKKIITLAVSSVISMSVLTVAAAAEETVAPPHSEFIENYSAAPRAALPAGAYYSTTNLNSFIRIDAGANTTCLVSVVIYDSNGNKVSGTGYHDYDLRSSFNIILNSWYTIDAGGNVSHDSGTFIIPATYSGGNIIIDATSEIFSL